MSTAPHPAQLGRYEIVSLLAQGGMAELFLARLPGIEGFAKRVVVKRVLPSLARDREFIAMFLEEARLAATLHHQNIVQVHDIGQDESGLFFAMEYLHGADVGEILREVDGRLPLEIALHVIHGACAGLHYAHERKSADGRPLGIVHRDVSPQNLFVTFDGGIKLLDFGIAKAVQQISSHYTRSGTLRGKLPYMSPEQCQGDAIDRRSDVFSLAVVLWELTVGERLFGAGQSEFETLKSIVERDAPRPSSRVPAYPPALEAIVMNGLARDRARRFQTCDEMQAHLETFMRASGRWATSRDVSAFLRTTFADRAASSMRLESKPPHEAEILPFPRTRSAPPPATDATIDLPRPDRVAVAPPTEPSPAPAPAGMPRRRVALLVAAAALLTGGAMTLGFVVAGQRGARANDPAAAPAAGSATPPAGATAAKPAEDRLWFQPDDYLVAAEELTKTKVTHLHVGKLLDKPDAHGEAEFLTTDGAKVRSRFFWTTHLARPDELAIGVTAFCRAEHYDKEVGVPKTKQDARQGVWIVGFVTDIAELPSKVAVADCVCDVAGVRVIDR